jgi:hypothetical protein
MDGYAIAIIVAMVCFIREQIIRIKFKNGSFHAGYRKCLNDIADINNECAKSVYHLSFLTKE